VDLSVSWHYGHAVATKLHKPSFSIEIHLQNSSSFCTVFLRCSSMFSFAGRLYTSCSPSRDTLHRRNGRRSANAKWKTGITSTNFSHGWRLERKASMEMTKEGNFEHGSQKSSNCVKILHSYVVFCAFSLIWIATFISLRWYFGKVLKEVYGENKNRDVWAKVFLNPWKKQQK